MAAWYTKKLDFRVTLTMPFGKKTLVLLSPTADDNFRVESIAGPAGSDRPSYESLIETHAVAGWLHLTLRVDDVDATAAELKRLGVEAVNDPRDALGLGLRLDFFSYPWGHLLELTQPI